jgi:hypothetical protein
VSGIVDVQEKYDLRPRLTSWELDVLNAYCDANAGNHVAAVGGRLVMGKGDLG